MKIEEQREKKKNIVSMKLEVFWLHVPTREERAAETI
jgi:hypothetical protein